MSVEKMMVNQANQQKTLFTFHNLNNVIFVSTGVPSVRESCVALLVELSAHHRQTLAVLRSWCTTHPDTLQPDAVRRLEELRVACQDKFSFNCKPFVWFWTTSMFYSDTVLLLKYCLHCINRLQYKVPTKLLVIDNLGSKAVKRFEKTWNGMLKKFLITWNTLALVLVGF